MGNQVKIIDLFAGPGGLGEGFSAYRSSNGEKPFKIALSVEKESNAHGTLKLRSFYRQFNEGEAPKEYYDFIGGKLGNRPEEQLYNIPALRKQVVLASEEARQFTLGKENKQIESAISKALGKNPGNWLLIGGPPCQAYSLVGRNRNLGNRSYMAERDHRNFLYREYLNIIDRFNPAVFVMENVKGLLSAKVAGESMFSKIIEDLKCPGKALKEVGTNNEYEIFSLVESITEDDTPMSFVIRSEQYGVPQARHRVILLGVRKDIARKASPDFLVKCQSQVTTQDVLQDLPKVRSGVTKEPDSPVAWKNAINKATSKTIKVLQRRGLDSVASVMAASIDSMDNETLNRGSNWAIQRTGEGMDGQTISEWYKDPSGWNGVCNHETRAHISSDLARYLFTAAFGSVFNRSPNASQFPKTLAPDHKNWESGKFPDRFKVQIASRCARTITSHISKDGHYFIHYDPTQCRSLTVREAARIQTFPDNYFFVGSRTDQFVQVGNAVPPYLANKIAGVVSKIFMAA